KETKKKKTKETKKQKGKTPTGKIQRAAGPQPRPEPRQVHTSGRTSGLPRRRAFADTRSGEGAGGRRRRETPGPRIARRTPRDAAAEPRGRRPPQGRPGGPAGPRVSATTCGPALPTHLRGCSARSGRTACSDAGLPPRHTPAVSETARLLSSAPVPEPRALPAVGLRQTAVPTPAERRTPLATAAPPRLQGLRPLTWGPPAGPPRSRVLGAARHTSLSRAGLEGQDRAGPPRRRRSRRVEPRTPACGRRTRSGRRRFKVSQPATRKCAGRADAPHRPRDPRGPPAPCGPRGPASSPAGGNVPAGRSRPDAQARGPGRRGAASPEVPSHIRLPKRSGRNGRGEVEIEPRGRNNCRPFPSLNAAEDETGVPWLPKVALEESLAIVETQTHFSSTFPFKGGSKRVLHEKMLQLKAGMQQPLEKGPAERRVDEQQTQPEEAGSSSVSHSGKYHSLIQDQARELTHLRQKMRMGRAFSSLLIQHVRNTMKTFEELLSSNKVDHYMEQHFREHLTKGSQLAESLASKFDTDTY
uniref:Uncharacterized protein n=1 Tax=Canis lupus familiaris TaxID=9615 RepID=A0A8C0QKR8_CANLF